MCASEYKRPQTDPDLEVQFEALPMHQGGRKAPFWQGYRTIHDFGIPNMSNDAQYEFDGDPPAPGGTTKAFVWLADPELQKGRLYIGMRIGVQEPAEPVAYITITKILKPELRRDA